MCHTRYSARSRTARRRRHGCSLRRQRPSRNASSRSDGPTWKGTRIVFARVDRLPCTKRKGCTLGLLRNGLWGTCHSPRLALWTLLHLNAKGRLAACCARSLAPMFPAVWDGSVASVTLRVGGQVVTEAGPLASCASFMDTGEHSTKIVTLPRTKGPQVPWQHARPVSARMAAALVSLPPPAHSGAPRASGPPAAPQPVTVVRGAGRAGHPARSPYGWATPLSA